MSVKVGKWRLKSFEFVFTVYYALRLGEAFVVLVYMGTSTE